MGLQRADGDNLRVAELWRPRCDRPQIQGIPQRKVERARIKMTLARRKDQGARRFTIARKTRRKLSNRDRDARGALIRNLRVGHLVRRGGDRASRGTRQDHDGDKRAKYSTLQFHVIPSFQTSDPGDSSPAQRWGHSRRREPVAHWSGSSRRFLWTRAARRPPRTALRRSRAQTRSHP
jgi:hypothetical protein